jgi:hypothetical protein
MKKILWLSFVCLFILLVIFVVPKFSLVNTDNFYWLWMAKNPSLWWKWNVDRVTSIQTIIYPHFYGFLFVPIFWLINISTYSPRFIFLINAIFIFGLIFIIKKIIKKLTNNKDWKWQLLWTLLVFFSGYWMLNFVLTGDISPRLPGIILLLLILEQIFFKKINKKQRIKIVILNLLLFLIHSPDLLYLYAALVIYGLLFGIKIFKKQVILIPGTLVAILLLTRFIIQISGWHDFNIYNLQYSYETISVFFTIKYFYYLAFGFSLLGIYSIFSKKSKNSNFYKYMICMFLLINVILVFPGQWAGSTEAIWASYRNIIYLVISVSFLSMKGVIWFINQINHKKVILFLLITWQAIFFSIMFFKVSFSRILLMPDWILAKMPASISQPFIAIGRDQSFFRENLNFFNNLDKIIPKNTNGLILTESWDLAFMGGSILNKDRSIFYLRYKKTAFVFYFRSILDESFSSEQIKQIIKESNIKWLIVDKYWYQRIQNGNFILQEEIDYWSWGDDNKSNVRDKSYYLTIEN